MAAPLRPWLWCVGWLFLIWTAVWFVTNNYWVLIEHPNGCFEKEISELEEGSFKFPIVIAFGDSQLYRSLPDPNEFAVQVDIDVHWMSFPRRSEKYREVLPVLAALSGMDVRLMLVQDSLLLQDRPSFLLKAKNILSLVLQNIMSGRSVFTARFCDAPFPHIKNQGMRFAGPNDGVIELLRGSYNYSIPLRQDALDFLEEARKVADKVVIFHLPRSAEMRLEEEKHWMTYLRTTLSPLDIDVVEMGESLPAGYYYDGRHTNSLGQKIRIKQFKELLLRHM